jgi:hypothetical protein
MPRELSPEAKQKLSQIAARRHREGDLGPPSLEHSRKGGLTAGRGRSKRSQRITEVWARIAAEHHKTEVQEIAQQGAQKSRDELIAILAQKLSDGPTANLIRGQIEAETITDAEVIEE